MHEIPSFVFVPIFAAVIQFHTVGIPVKLSIFRGYMFLQIEYIISETKRGRLNSILSFVITFLEIFKRNSV